MAPQKEMTMPRIHNGTYTMRRVETGEHRTFKIRTVKDGALEGKRIVALLTGPDNRTDFTGFGFVEDDRISVWKKCRGDGKKSAYEWYAEMLVHLGCEDGTFRDHAYTVTVSKKCLKCNRKLTNPESLMTGYGPECGGRI